MNYQSLFKKFKQEQKQLCQYKNIDNPVKTLAFIATFPFWVFSFLTICYKYCYLFFFYFLSSSSDYLEAWVKDTTKDVNPYGTQAVIYFVTTPFIFFLRCILSITCGSFYILWFLSMCFNYIATLGGIRWQPFISQATYEDNIQIKSNTNKLPAQVVICISFALLSFAFFFLLCKLASAFGIFMFLYFVFTIIAIPVTFKKTIIKTDSIEENNCTDKTDSIEENNCTDKTDSIEENNCTDKSNADN